MASNNGDSIETDTVPLAGSSGAALRMALPGAQAAHRIIPAHRVRHPTIEEAMLSDFNPYAPGLGPEAVLTMIAGYWREKPGVPVKQGDRVLYRHDQDGELIQAEVLGVDDNNQSDPMVYGLKRLANGQPDFDLRTGTINKEKRRDPWPTVQLKADGWQGVVVTREARVQGSPGWYPVGWTPVPEYQ